MLDELLLVFFIASIYQADQAGKFTTSLLAHNALHAVAMYRGRL